MTDIRPKPDGVEIPDGERWEDLTSYQRYYYENKEQEKQRVEERKQELQDWLQSYKDDLSCNNCAESRNPCLDFHHVEESDKEIKIADMPRNGYGRETIKEEIDKCIILCANCHRVEHQTERFK